MIGLTDDGFEQGQSPRSEPVAELSETGRLVPVDDGEVGRDLDRGTFEYRGHHVGCVVNDGRHERPTAAVVTDNQMQEKVPAGRLTQAGVPFQPRANQSCRQLFVATASGPSGGGACRIPPVARHVRLGHPDAVVLFAGIEPALESPVCLADVVQPTGAFHDLSQLGRNPETLRDRPRPHGHCCAVQIQLDGRLGQRHLIEFVAARSAAGRTPGEPGHLVADCDDLPGQGGHETVPLCLIPAGRCRSGNDGQDLLYRLGPFGLVDVFFVGGGAQRPVDEITDGDDAEPLERRGVQRHALLGD